LAEVLAGQCGKGVIKIFL